jgi:benzoyl-CoA-dihydrodiol lyase
LLILKTRGDLDAVSAADESLAQGSSDWLVHEILMRMKRTLKRLDLTSRTVLALIEPGSCFAGSLMELALAADRSYMLDSAESKVRIAMTSLNRGALPMGNGLSRLQPLSGASRSGEEILGRSPRSRLRRRPKLTGFRARRN